MKPNKTKKLRNISSGLSNTVIKNTNHLIKKCLSICPFTLTSIGPLESCFETLWWFTGEFDGHLQQRDGEVAVLLSGHPQAETFVNAVRICQHVHQLIHEVQPQVAVLQQSPATLCVCVTEGERKKAPI